MNTWWGIDLGGTKIEGIVIPAGEPQTTIARHRIPTEAHLGYDHLIERIAQLVRELEAKAGMSAPPILGFGTPGALDRHTGLMKNCNTTSLNGRSLDRDLAQALGREVRLANDANLFALAEARLGAAVGYRTVFGVILGTGVGGGIVVEGHLLDGPHGIAGEWGHNVLDPDGRPCYCGNRGCVETVISGPALQEFYAGRTGRTLRLEEILVRADDGEPEAVATRQRLIDRFGQAIAVVVNILDPDAIVLGGGVGRTAGLATEGQAAARAHVFNRELRTPFLLPELGDSAGVFGAALLAGSAI